MDPQIETYIEKQIDPQKKILIKLRRLINKTMPNVKESFKNGVPWYEDKFYLVGLKTHVNMGFAVAGLNESELAMLDGKGKIMRHLKYCEPGDIDEKKLIKLLKIVDKKFVPCH